MIEGIRLCSRTQAGVGEALVRHRRRRFEVVTEAERVADLVHGAELDRLTQHAGGQRLTREKRARGR